MSLGFTDTNLQAVLSSLGQIKIIVIKVVTVINR